MTTEKLRHLIRSTGTKYFHVTFTKRTTGEKRTFAAQLGVFKHTTGDVEAARKKLEIDLEHDLLTVFVPNLGYRSIPLDGVEEFSCGETVYRKEQA